MRFPRAENFRTEIENLTAQQREQCQSFHPRQLPTGGYRAHTLI